MKILIVEDEIIIALELEATLVLMGHEVIGRVNSGEKAIGFVTGSGARPDLVFMDLVLAGEINGIEAAAVLTKEQGIPVVFVSGYSDTEVVSLASKVHPYRFLVKPVRDEELREVIGALEKDLHAGIPHT